MATGVGPVRVETSSPGNLCVCLYEVQLSTAVRTSFLYRIALVVWILLSRGGDGRLRVQWPCSIYGTHVCDHHTHRLHTPAQAAIGRVLPVLIHSFTLVTRGLGKGGLLQVCRRRRFDANACKTNWLSLPGFVVFLVRVSIAQEYFLLPSTLSSHWRCHSSIIEVWHPLGVSCDESPLHLTTISTTERSTYFMAAERWSNTCK